jgi:DNA-directed RNA polymerase specialized sigma24 family protein
VTESREDMIARVLPNYRAILMGMARRMCPNPHASVEDLAQEGHIAMWRAVEKHKAGNLAGWLTTSARNRMTSVASGKSALGNEVEPGVYRMPPSQSLDVLHEAGWDAPDDDIPDMTDLVIAAYHEGEIALALDSLTEKQRAAVIKMFCHGERITHVTKEMGLGNTWWQRVRPILAEQLAHLKVA